METGLLPTILGIVPREMKYSIFECREHARWLQTTRDAIITNIKMNMGGVGGRSVGVRMGVAQGPEWGLHRGQNGNVQGARMGVRGQVKTRKTRNQ